MGHHPIDDEHRAGGDDYLRSRKHTIADQALTHLLDDRCELPSPKGERTSRRHSTIWNHHGSPSALRSGSSPSTSARARLRLAPHACASTCLNVTLIEIIVPT